MVLLETVEFLASLDLREPLDFKAPQVVLEHLAVSVLTEQRESRERRDLWVQLASQEIKDRLVCPERMD